MAKTCPWKQYDWPLTATKPIHHLAMEDLRKQLWLMLYAKNATAEKTEFAGKAEGHEGRFAPLWADWMLPYSDALTHDFTQAETSEPQYQAAPGNITVWYEDSFSSSISGIDFSQNPKGELVISNCQQITKNSIWSWNGTGYPSPQQEQWYKEYDDWRPGTPFTLTGCGDERNNGFYRVKSRRMNGSTLYITPCDNDGNDIQLFADTQGTMTCNFGGDWWTIRGMNGHVSASCVYADNGPDGFFSRIDDETKYTFSKSGNWWTQKDRYHRYDGNARGPNDGRPPSGGAFAVDLNGDWIRGVNPSLYHCYDKNSHRYILSSDWDDFLSNFTLYFAGWRADEMLSEHVDPKEQISPWYFLDKKNCRWKYGEKVPIRKSQITNATKLGAIDHAKSYAWQDTQNNWHCIATHQQYRRSVLRVLSSGAAMINFGDKPMLKTLLSARDWWEQAKYDCAIQNMVELLAEQQGWMLPVDNAYKENWFAVNHPSWLTNDYLPYGLELELYDNVQSRTYQTAYAEFGIGAYRPEWDPTAPAYAELHDELWGENGSAIELILKTLGDNYYDWYYDDIYPFVSERVLKTRTLFLASPGYWTFPVTVHGIVCNSVADIANVCWPIPIGTWRRTWKRTLGYVREGKMRDSSLGEPTCQAYANYSWVGPDSDYRLAMPGRHRFSDPASTDYGGSDLQANHGPEFKINDTDVFRGRAWKILNDCQQVMDRLNIAIVSEVGIQFFNKFLNLGWPPGETGTAQTPFEIIDRHQRYKDMYWNDPSKYLIYPTPSGAEINSNCGYKAAADYHTIIPPGWSFAESCTDEWEEIYAQASVFGEIDRNAVRFMIRLGCRCANPSLEIDFYFQSPTILGIAGYGTIEPPPYHRSRNPDVVNGLSYLHLYASVDAINNLRIYTLGNLFNGDYVNQYCWRSNTRVYIEPLVSGGAGDGLLGIFNWNEYSDKIWRRMAERADVRLIDIFGDDTRPPVVKNEWIKKPLLQNENWVYLPLGTIYDYKEHVPSYKVSAESIWMEDLEGIDEDEVWYIFDFGNTDLSDQMDRSQTSRIYDKLLLSGDHDAAEEVFTDGWDDGTPWNVKLNTRDNAQARGNEENNYGTPTAPENLSLDDVSMPHFPLRPIIHTEKINVDGVWYDHVWVDPPYIDSDDDIYYRLSGFIKSTLPGGWYILYDFDDAIPLHPGEYPEGPNHFYVSGDRIKEDTPMIYQIQCRVGTATTGKRGMWSKESAEPVIMLKIQNPNNYVIILNGQPLTFTNGEWVGYIKFNVNFVLECIDPWEYFGWTIEYPGGYKMTVNNPLTYRAFADLTIFAS